MTDKLQCPARCGCCKSRVVDSRVSTDGTHIDRRRECVQCKTRYTTQERMVGVRRAQ